jgi:uncharacterized protein YqkB
LPCEGYGIKLYWITNDDTVAPSAIKRQAMTLEGNFCPLLINSDQGLPLSVFADAVQSKETAHGSFNLMKWTTN